MRRDVGVEAVLKMIGRCVLLADILIYRWKLGLVEIARAVLGCVEIAGAGLRLVEIAVVEVEM